MWNGHHQLQEAIEQETQNLLDDYSQKELSREKEYQDNQMRWAHRINVNMKQYMDSVLNNEVSKTRAQAV